MKRERLRHRAVYSGMTRLAFLSQIPAARQGARARDAASPGTLDFLTPAR